MTTPDPTPPAVSPVDTAALREQVATTLEERIGDNSDLYETVDDVLAVVSPLLSASADSEGQAVARQAVLRADLGKAQREIERLTAERDAYREADRQSQSNWRGAVAANMTALETIATLKRALAGHLFDGESVSTREAIRNELIEQGLTSGARPIPDDAAERLRKLAVEFRSLSDQSVADALSGEPAEDECDSPAECHGAAACWTWKLAARQVEKLAESLATPTTGPAPAAADVQWGVRFGDGEVVQQSGEEPARAYAEWQNQAGETKTPVELVSRTVSVWTPAAPQAPAEPTKKLATAKHPRNHSLDTHALHDCGGDLKCCGDPDEEAAREDAATPMANHKVTVAVPLGGPASARCNTCSLGTTGTEQEVDDWADAHRADTLRPSGPLAPIRHEEE